MKLGHTTSVIMLAVLMGMASCLSGAETTPTAGYFSREERTRRHKEEVEKAVLKARQQRAMQRDEAASVFTPVVTERSEAPVQSSQPMPMYRGTVITPPEITVEGTNVTAVFNDVALSRVLDQISRQTSATIMACGRAGRETVSLIVRNQPLDQVLEKIVSDYPNLLLIKPPERPGTYEIWDYDNYRYRVLAKVQVEKVYNLRVISGDEAKNIIEHLLTPQIGHVIVVNSSRRVIVNDVPEVQAKVAKILEEVDQKPAYPRAVEQQPGPPMGAAGMPPMPMGSPVMGVPGTPATPPQAVSPQVPQDPAAQGLQVIK